VFTPVSQAHSPAHEGRGMDNQTDQISENVQVAPEVVENHDTQVQEPQLVAEAKAQESSQERNWKAVRERQRDLERKLKMQEELNEKLMQMVPQQAPKQEVDELDNIGDEEFIPTGKVKKLVAKQKTHIVKEAVAEVEKLLQQREQSQFLDKLRKHYSDFDDIVNPETLEILEIQKPELAATIAELKDPYKMGVQSYEMIKALNISAKTPEVRRAKEVDKKLEKNSKTVQSPQAYDKRPMAQAFRITDAEKKQLYQEMHQYASMASSVPEVQ
jgi:hypothetical protein